MANSIKFFDQQQERESRNKAFNTEQLLKSTAGAQNISALSSEENRLYLEESIEPSDFNQVNHKVLNAFNKNGIKIASHDTIRYQPIDDQDLVEMDIVDDDIAHFMKEKATKTMPLKNDIKTQSYRDAYLTSSMSPQQQQDMLKSTQPTNISKRSRMNPAALKGQSAMRVTTRSILFSSFNNNVDKKKSEVTSNKNETSAVLESAVAHIEKIHEASQINKALLQLTDF